MFMVKNTTVSDIYATRKEIPTFTVLCFGYIQQRNILSACWSCSPRPFLTCALPYCLLLKLLKFQEYIHADLTSVAKRKL